MLCDFFSFFDDNCISDLQDAAFGKVKQMVAERKSAIEAIAREMCTSGNDTISGRRIVEIVDSTPKDEIASQLPEVHLLLLPTLSHPHSQCCHFSAENDKACLHCIRIHTKLDE